MSLGIGPSIKRSVASPNVTGEFLLFFKLALFYSLQQHQHNVKKKKDHIFLQAMLNFYATYNTWCMYGFGCIDEFFEFPYIALHSCFQLLLWTNFINRQPGGNKLSKK